MQSVWKQWLGHAVIMCIWMTCMTVPVCGDVITEYDEWGYDNAAEIGCYEMSDIEVTVVENLSETDRRYRLTFQIGDRNRKQLETFLVLHDPKKTFGGEWFIAYQDVSPYGNTFGILQVFDENPYQPRKERGILHIRTDVWSTEGEDTWMQFYSVSLTNVMHYERYRYSFAFEADGTNTLELQVPCGTYFVRINDIGTQDALGQNAAGKELPALLGLWNGYQYDRLEEPQVSYADYVLYQDSVLVTVTENTTAVVGYYMAEDYRGCKGMSPEELFAAFPEYPSAYSMVSDADLFACEPFVPEGNLSDYQQDYALYCIAKANGNTLPEGYYACENWLSRQNKGSYFPKNISLSLLAEKEGENAPWGSLYWDSVADEYVYVFFDETDVEGAICGTYDKETGCLEQFFTEEQIGLLSGEGAWKKLELLQSLTPVPLGGYLPEGDFSFLEGIVYSETPAQETTTEALVTEGSTASVQTEASETASFGEEIAAPSVPALELEPTSWQLVGVLIGLLVLLIFAGTLRIVLGGRKAGNDKQD